MNKLLYFRRFCIAGFSALLLCLVWMSITGISGCTTQGDTRVTEFAKTNAPTAAVAAAGGFLYGLLKQNLLPGISKDEHGHLESENLTLTDSNMNVVLYPLVHNFTATKTGDKSYYHYTVEQSGAHANWNLKRAWRTDSAGHVIEELPIQASPADSSH